MNLLSLIKEGEHQRQDFKYKISNVNKIAHSISAFANTDGGRLLVGIHDDGRIAGVDSDEEIYMIDAAAQSFCRPAVDCAMESEEIHGRKVLIVSIPKSEACPVMAKEEDGTYRAYVRVDDENIVASPVHLALWRSGDKEYTFTQKELSCLSFLTEQGITLNRFSRLCPLSRKASVWLMASFVRFGLAEIYLDNHIWRFREVCQRK